MPNSRPLFEKLEAHLESERFKMDMEKNALTPDEAYIYSQYRQTHCARCVSAHTCKKDVVTVEECIHKDLTPARKISGNGWLDLIEKKRSQLASIYSMADEGVGMYRKIYCGECSRRHLCQQTDEKVKNCMSDDITDSYYLEEMNDKPAKKVPKNRWQALDICVDEKPEVEK